MSMWSLSSSHLLATRQTSRFLKIFCRRQNSTADMWQKKSSNFQVKHGEVLFKKVVTQSVCDSLSHGWHFQAAVEDFSTRWELRPQETVSRWKVVHMEAHWVFGTLVRPLVVLGDIMHQIHIEWLSVLCAAMAFPREMPPPQTGQWTDENGEVEVNVNNFCFCATSDFCKPQNWIWWVDLIDLIDLIDLKIYWYFEFCMASSFSSFSPSLQGPGYLCVRKPERLAGYHLQARPWIQYLLVLEDWWRLRGKIVTILKLKMENEVLLVDTPILLTSQLWFHPPKKS